MPTTLSAPPGKVEAFLKRIPIFSEMDAEHLALLARGASLVGFDLGETIFKEGDSGDAFYVIVKGGVRVVSAPDPRDPDREVWLSTLGPGDHFGEVALVTGSPRSSTCRTAGEDVTVLARIGSDAFKPLVDNAAVRKRFLELGDFYRIWNFLKVMTALGSVLVPEDLKDMVPIFEPRQFRKDAVIMEEGDDRAPFLIVRSGWVNVSAPRGVLTEGKYLGETSILAGAPGLARVTAASDSVHVLLAPREPFLAFLEKHPGVRAHLEANPCRPVAMKAVKPPRASVSIPMTDAKVFLGLQAEPSKDETTVVSSISALGDAQIPLRPSSRPVPPEAKKTASHVKKPFFYRVYRFPFIRQHDETDCGGASLAMICRFHGKKVSLGRLRDLANVSTEGSSLQSLAQAAETLGFIAHGGRFTGENVDRQELPAIVHWGGFHFVVLYKIDGQKAWIADPAVGLRRLTRAEFDEKFTGYMLLLEPTDRLSEVRDAKTSFRRFTKQLRPFLPLLVEIVIASLVLDVFGLAAPLFTQAIVDKVIPHQNARLLGVMLGGMLILAAFRIATQAMRSYLVANLSVRLDLRMLLKFYYHVLALPIGFFKLRKTGDILTRFGENAKIRQILTGSAVSTILDALMIVVYLALMLNYNTKLTLAVLAFIPLFVIATLTFTPIMKRLNQRVFVANSEQESFLVESVGGIETIKALSVERPTRWRWEALFTRYLHAVYDTSKVEVALSSVSDALSSASSIALLGYGASLVIDGELTVGQLMAFNALIGAVMTPIGGLIALWDKIQQAIVSMDRLNDILDSEPEEAGGRTTLIDPADLQGEIKFDRVFFRYNATDGPYVLENLTLTIAAGTTVAIVGRSGSGKSTLARLILKLHLPTQGMITIDGLDLTALSAHGIRRRTGFVSQEVNLFSGTIAENIALGVEEIDRRRLDEVGRIAEAHGFISAMPMGYDTLVGERGLTLSGGQRQRISIARALYHDPKILIFDEATASLDTESEAAIQDNLKRITAGRTAIIIAHRMSTVRHADKILVVDKGRLIEEGPHEELIAQKGLYHQLCSRQLEL